MSRWATSRRETSTACRRRSRSARLAARKVADRLATLAVPAPEYTAWRSGVTTSQVIEAKVADVRVEGLEYVNPEYLRTLTTVEAGDAVAVGDISDDARHMAALDELDTVAYRLEGDPSASTLVWLPKEISLGQNVLRPALGLFRRWRRRLQVPDGRAARPPLGQPARGPVAEPDPDRRRVLPDDELLPAARRRPAYFRRARRFSSSASWRTCTTDGERIATYQFIDLGGRIDLGWNTSRYAQFRLGYLFDQRKTRIDTGLEVLPQIDAADAGLEFSARFDSRDTPTFATKGFAAAVRYEVLDDSFGSDRDWERLEAGIRKSISIGKYVTWLSLGRRHRPRQRSASRTAISRWADRAYCRGTSTTSCA